MRKRYLSAKAAADELGIFVQQISTLVRFGVLKAEITCARNTKGRRYKIPAAEVRRLKRQDLGAVQ